MRLNYSLCLLSLIAALALALLAAGCGGGVQAAAEPAAFPSAVEPPHPDALARHASFYYDSQRRQIGQQASSSPDSYAQYATVDAGELILTPPNDPALTPAFVNSARANFRFEHLEDYQGRASVELEWSTPPAAGQLWVALANFATGKWEWQHPTGTAEAVFGSEGTPYVNGAGNVLVLIFVTGGGEARLARISFGPDIWDVTAVDSAGATGFYTSLALDSTGHEHIAYYDQDNQDLRYAYFNGFAFELHTMDGAASATGKTPSIALTSADQPVFAYQDEDRLVLRLASFDGVVTTVADADPAANTGYAPSLAVDSTDNANVAYYCAATMTYQFAKQTTGGWEYSTIAARNGSLDFQISLALDATDVPHVLYSDGGVATYAYFEAGAWHAEPIGGVKAAVGSRSLAFSPDGARLWAAYYDYETARAYVSERTGGGWSAPELIADEDNFGWGGSLAVGADGYPRYACYGNGPRYLAKTAIGWRDVNWDSDGWSGHYNSLVLDSAGLAHISYLHPGNEDLRFARQLAPEF